MSMLALFQSYNIVWENKVVEIPLYESVEEYLYLPKAKVYVNNQVIENANSYYEYGVNHTFISVVNSNHVKSFFIDYKVYFPTQNIESVQTIEFKIVDLTPPRMLYVPELKSPLGQKVIDVKKDIIYEDNYYDTKDIQVFIDISKVNINKVGTYEVVYTLVDKSLNQTKYIASYEVYDETPPTIKLKKDLYHEINTSFRWQNYFSITDNDPNNLKVVVSDEFVDYYKLGKYIILIVAIDNSLNRTVYEDIIEIIDTTPPELKLTSNPDHIEVLTVLSDFDLLEFVIQAIDNETSYNDLRWVITHDIDTNRIGTYQITYQLFDNSNNKAEKNIKVQVKDTISPIITLTKPLSFEVYQEEIIILDYFLFDDNFDLDYELKIKLEGSVNFKKVGIYPIIIAASDLSKNERVFKTNVYIIDSIPPVITQIKEFIIHPKEIFDAYDYFIFEDNYDTNLNIYFDIPNDLDVVGSYYGTVGAYDSSKNYSQYNFEIIVIDLKAPTITLSKEIEVIEEGYEINFKSFIVSVYDDVTSLTIDDVIVDDSNFQNKRGVYKIHYILYDEALNKTIESLLVYVSEKDNITFEVMPLFKKVNEVIEHHEGVIIIGNNYNYEFKGQTFYEKEGKYTITHIIISEYGKIYTIDQQVTVTMSFNVSKHIIPILAVSLGVIASFILVFKRPKSSNNSFDK